MHTGDDSSGTSADLGDVLADPALAWAARYGRARDLWLDQVVATLGECGQVAQVWSVGSAGRAGSDDLSDVDLVAVPMPSALPDVVADPVALLPLPGPMLAHRRHDRNGPAGGAYMAICVEVEALPLWVDLYVWPQDTAELPADATMLVDRSSGPVIGSDLGFVALIDAHRASSGESDGGDVEVLRRVCVAAKYLARNNRDALARTTRAWAGSTNAAASVVGILHSQAAATPADPHLKDLVTAWVDLCVALQRTSAQKSTGHSPDPAQVSVRI